MYIIGNWKSHPGTLAEARSLAVSIARISKNDTSVIICAPYVFVREVLGAGIASGVQDIAVSDETVTGEVTATQVASLGIQYAIVGHSERRARGETSDQVHAKIAQCLGQGITPVVCIGESVRDESGAYLSELRDQIQITFAGCTRADLEKMIVAYEPVWAIGSKALRECTPAECQETVRWIRAELISQTGNMPVGKIAILYGGSVNSTNAHDYMATNDIDGFLIGRASLNAEELEKIINI